MEFKLHEIIKTDPNLLNDMEVDLIEIIDEDEESRKDKSTPMIKAKLIISISYHKLRTQMIAAKRPEKQTSDDNEDLKIVSMEEGSLPTTTS